MNTKQGLVKWGVMWRWIVTIATWEVLVHDLNYREQEWWYSVDMTSNFPYLLFLEEELVFPRKREKREGVRKCTNI